MFGVTSSVADSQQVKQTIFSERPSDDVNVKAKLKADRGEMVPVSDSPVPDTPVEPPPNEPPVKLVKPSWQLPQWLVLAILLAVVAIWFAGGGSGPAPKPKPPSTTSMSG